MNWNRGRSLAAAAIAATAVAGAAAAQQQKPQPPAPPMGFFITSVGLGSGGNLGGLAGADKHCQTLAAAAGAGNRTWRAYLSAQGTGTQPPVNARDRIGTGPWFNAKGQMIAANVADLHGDIERDRNQINKTNALNEMAMPINGVGDKPNQHDIITGSDSLGRARASETVDTTCSNYTSNQDPPQGTARGQGPGVWLGHHDRTGGGNSSWNAAHKSGGCSQQALVNTGGAGLLYCFAAN